MYKHISNSVFVILIIYEICHAYYDLSTMHYIMCTIIYKMIKVILHAVIHLYLFLIHIFIFDYLAFYTRYLYINQLCNFVVYFWFAMIDELTQKPKGIQRITATVVVTTKKISAKGSWQHFFYSMLIVYVWSYAFNAFNFQR